MTEKNPWDFDHISGCRKIYSDILKSKATKNPKMYSYINEYCICNFNWGAYDKNVAIFSFND